MCTQASRALLLERQGKRPPARALHSTDFLQVQDSEVGEDGESPKHCHVSGATRQELTGYLQRRISQSRCKASATSGRGLQAVNGRWCVVGGRRW